MSRRRRGGGDPRERLINASIEVIGRCGFNEAKVLDICLLAGVSSRTFYRIFGVTDAKEACVAAVLDAKGPWLLGLAKESFDQTAGLWEYRIDAAVRRFLAELARDEPLARVLFVELANAGALAAERLAALVEQAEQLFAPLDRPNLPSGPGSESVVVGMMLYPIADYVGQEKIDELPELAPVLTYFLTLFVIGVDEAQGLARTYAVRSNGPPPKPIGTT